jgi:hypothetical protein
MKKGNSAQESGKCNNQLMNLISMLKVFFYLRSDVTSFLLLVIDRTYNMCLSSFALWMREKSVLICILFCFMDARKQSVFSESKFFLGHVTVSKTLLCWKPLSEVVCPTTPCTSNMEILAYQLHYATLSLLAFL